MVIANEEDCSDVLGIKAGDTDVHSGSLDTSRYPDVARKVVAMFPNVSKVAITLRESYSASHNNWGAMLYDATAGNAVFAPLDADGNYQSYEINRITSYNVCYTKLLRLNAVRGKMVDSLNPIYKHILKEYYTDGHYYYFV